MKCTKDSYGYEFDFEHHTFKGLNLTIGKNKNNGTVYIKDFFDNILFDHGDPTLVYVLMNIKNESLFIFVESDILELYFEKCRFIYLKVNTGTIKQFKLYDTSINTIFFMKNIRNLTICKGGIGTLYIYSDIYTNVQIAGIIIEGIYFQKLNYLDLYHCTVDRVQGRYVEVFATSETKIQDVFIFTPQPLKDGIVNSNDLTIGYVRHPISELGQETINYLLAEVI